MDFDTIIERRDTGSIKWNKYKGRDIIPMWIADMDFRCPPTVLTALHQRIEQGILGYSEPGEALIEAISRHAQTLYQWALDPDWFVWLPGLVQGLNLACRAVGTPGDSVLCGTPIYPPFLSAPRLAGRELITVPLQLSNNRWSWDFGALTASVTKNTRLLLLCHPHNPVGRAWQEEELSELIDFSRRHDLIICSDEIHCDLILDPQKHHRPLAQLDPEFAARTITLMAPSKTWNLPGLGCSFALIPDPALRDRFRTAMMGLTPSINLLGLTAAEAAYRDDDGWRRHLLEYLKRNREILGSWIAPSRRLHWIPPEASYLAWIDASALDPENPAALFEQHGVGVSDGRDFGLPGYVRLNFACPRPRLEEALARLDPLR